MASNLPSFQFPSGDTPPLKETSFTLHDTNDDDGLFDGNTLSPLSARFPPYNPLTANLNSPARSSHLSPYSPSNSFASDNEAHSTTASSGPDSARQPFGFTPQQYVVSRPAGAQLQQKQTELGRRRGHKYARSSVSHQIILSPTPRLPLQLPTSLPVPTFKELRASMTSAQRMRWVLCLAQFGVAGYVQWQAEDSMAMHALSHLLFYEALGCVLCTAVAVGGNFEVWSRSSLRHPFGLQRSELVAGLAMSIVLLFMGLDLISHGLTHSLENVGGHEAHHAHVHHTHNGEQAAHFNIAALVAILSTLISGRTMGVEGRVGRSVTASAQRTGWIARMLQNKPVMLILSLATILSALPLLTIQPSPALDMSLSFLAAAFMIFLGSRLCYTIGRVLLMSYPSTAGNGGDISELIAELWEDDAIVEVAEVKVWQVHYGLCMANFRVSVRSRDAVQRVREKIDKLVRSRLAGESTAIGAGAGTGAGTEGRNAVKWEISSVVSVAGSGLEN